MAQDSSSIRMRTVVGWDDMDFTVRLASFDDLVAIQRNAQTLGLRARWSSEEALRNQVEQGGTIIICPLVRNGGTAEDRPSYRCYVGFVMRTESRRVVSFIDVEKEHLETMPEASDPRQLKQVIGIALEGANVEAIW